MTSRSAALGRGASVHPTIARLLCMRGFGDPEPPRAS